MNAATDLSEIIRVIGSILAEKCGIQVPVEPGSRLAQDLGLDSVGMLTLALEVENFYRMNLGDQPDKQPHTVLDVANLVIERLKERNQSK